MPTRAPGGKPSIGPNSPPAAAALAPAHRWAAGSVAEVAANIANDPFVIETLRDMTTRGSSVFSNAAVGRLTLGQPVFVRSIVPTSPSIWLVPALSGQDVVGVLGAKLRPDGTALAGVYSGWAGAFPHGISATDAIARGSAREDPVVSAEVVWAIVSPLEGGPADEIYPFYRLVRSHGSEWYLFQNGNLVSAERVHPLNQRA